jgi:hypothetical protein
LSLCLSEFESFDFHHHNMEVDPPPAEPERVQTLWFEDGNLIIKARLSLFRVYRGILAAQSVVFKDMLSFPQPSESETVEGCPVVVLQDSAEDALVFFRAIFDSGFVAFRVPMQKLTASHKASSCRIPHQLACLLLSESFASATNMKWTTFDVVP